MSPSRSESKTRVQLLEAIAEAALPVIQLDAALDYDPDNELTTAQRITLDMRFNEALMVLADRVAALSPFPPTPERPPDEDDDA